MALIYFALQTKTKKITTNTRLTLANQVKTKENRMIYIMSLMAGFVCIFLSFKRIKIDILCIKYQQWHLKSKWQQKILYMLFFCQQQNSNGIFFLVSLNEEKTKKFIVPKKCKMQTQSQPWSSI